MASAYVQLCRQHCLITEEFYHPLNKAYSHYQPVLSFPTLTAEHHSLPYHEELLKESVMQGPSMWKMPTMTVEMNKPQEGVISEREGWEAVCPTGRNHNNKI